AGKGLSQNFRNRSKSRGWIKTRRAATIRWEVKLIRGFFFLVLGTHSPFTFFHNLPLAFAKATPILVVVQGLPDSEIGGKELSFAPRSCDVWAVVLGWSDVPI